MGFLKSLFTTDRENGAVDSHQVGTIACWVSAVVIAFMMAGKWIYDRTPIDANGVYLVGALLTAAFGISFNQARRDSYAAPAVKADKTGTDTAG